MKRLVAIAAILACSTAAWCAPKPKVRISGWYWLNSAPKTDWQGDFVTMKNLGFTDVLLGWGLDASAAARRIPDTKQAIRWAHQAGLGAYVFLWHPTANTLTRKPEFMQVDSAGHVLPTFDVFNPEWRSTEWKTYLQTLARAYGPEPGMAGYVFDDTFFAAGNGVVSYGAFEKKAFGEPLPKKAGDPRWDEWIKAREGWWEDWARDTTSYIRTIDRNPHHEIYLEDSLGSIVNPDRLNTRGLDFMRVAKYFDEVGGYTSVSWDDSPDSGQKTAAAAAKSIEEVRKLVGPRKNLVYTFWIANFPEEHNPGPAKYPSAEQIKLVCEAALKAGIRHLDMYGFRIGDSELPGHSVLDWVPNDPAPYKLTGQFPQKFLWDRPQIHQELANYLLSLNR